MRKLKFISLAAALTMLLALPLTVSAVEQDLTGIVGVTAAGPTEKLNVKEGTVVSNVFSFGTSLSGLTESEAAAKIEETRDDALGLKLHTMSADKDKEWETTLKELGVSLEDITTSLETVKSHILKGSLLTRYKAAKAMEKEPVYMTAGLVIDEASILSKIEEALDGWNQDVQEASATVRNGSLEVIPGQSGHRYDFTPGVENFIEALKSGEVTKAGGYELENVYTTVEPTLSTDKVKGFTVIGSYSTKYDAPGNDQILKNRQQNLITSTNHVSGHVFAPGEVISALGMYGPVNTANGFAVAGTYTGGGHTDEVGGGICQTTTTIYNAVLRAELEVVYRKNHSYIVNYVDPSLDAMVYAPGGSDFKFKNSSSDYIIMDAWVNTANQTVNVNIIGHEDHPAGHEVKFVSQIESITMPVINNIPVDSLKIGWGAPAKFQDPGNFFIMPAVVSTSYKVVYENGVEVSRTKLTHDSYKRCDSNMYVAKDVIVEAVKSNNVRDCYVSVMTFYRDSNKTPINANPGSIDMAKFNDDMNALNIGWAVTGTAIQPAKDPGTGGYVPESSEESSSEESSSEESSGETP